MSDGKKLFLLVEVTSVVTYNDEGFPNGDVERERADEGMIFASHEGAVKHLRKIAEELSQNMAPRRFKLDEPTYKTGTYAILEVVTPPPLFQHGSSYHIHKLDFHSEDI